MEVGVIGREGMSGLAVLMGADRSPNDTFMQLAGGGRRISVEAFAQLMKMRPALLPRRPGVTIALSLLEKTGLVEVARGVITVKDRDGLIESSNGGYGVAEAEMRRLFQ